MIYIILSFSKFRLFGLSNHRYLFAYVFHTFKKLYDTPVLCLLLPYYAYGWFITNSVTVCWMSRLIIIGNNTVGWTFTKMTARSEVRNTDTNAERYIRLFDISKRNNVHFFLREKNGLGYRPFNFLESDPCHTRKFLSLCHQIFMNFFTSYLHRIYILQRNSFHLFQLYFIRNFQALQTIQTACILFVILEHVSKRSWETYLLWFNRYTHCNIAWSWKLKVGREVLKTVMNRRTDESRRSE